MRHSGNRLATAGCCRRTIWPALGLRGFGSGYDNAQAQGFRHGLRRFQGRVASLPAPALQWGSRHAALRAGVELERRLVRLLRWLRSSRLQSVPFPRHNFSTLTPWMSNPTCQDRRHENRKRHAGLNTGAGRSIHPSSSPGPATAKPANQRRPPDQSGGILAKRENRTAWGFEGGSFGCTRVEFIVLA